MIRTGTGKFTVTLKIDVCLRPRASRVRYWNPPILSFFVEGVADWTASVLQFGTRGWTEDDLRGAARRRGREAKGQ